MTLQTVFQFPLFILLVVPSLVIADLGSTRPASRNVLVPADQVQVEIEAMLAEQRIDLVLDGCLKSTDPDTRLRCVNLLLAHPARKHLQILKKYRELETDLKVQEAMDVAIEQFSLLPEEPKTRPSKLDRNSTTTATTWDEVQREGVISFRNLHSLNMRDVVVSADELSELQRLHSLEVVLLPPSLTNEGMIEVGKAKSLTTLFFARCSITDVGLEPLAALDKLQAIDLSLVDRLSGTGLVHVSSLKHLQQLCLPESINPENLSHLKHIPSLKILVLCQPYSTTLVTALADCQQLDRIDFRGHKLTDSQLAALSAVLPKTRIATFD